MIARSPEAAVLDKYADLAPGYDRGEALFERLLLSGLRRRLATRALGRVLEVAAGTGATLPYYNPGTSVTAVDLSAPMLAQARLSGRAGGHARDLCLMDAQRLAFKDGSFDTVVCTLALCTIPDPSRAVREMARVCRPGGRLLLLEHVRSYGRWIGWVQDRLAPGHFRRFCCRVNQETRAILESAGLQPALVERRLFGVFALMEASVPA